MKRTSNIFACILAVLAMAAYANSARNGFTYDENIVILRNETEESD